MRHDLLLVGGHVLDPAAGLDGRRDVAFWSGRVAAVDTRIPREPAREVVDVSGAYVAPGLIDLHAPAFLSGHDVGIETDAVCAATGVTTPRLTVRAGRTRWRRAVRHPRANQRRRAPSTIR